MKFIGDGFREKKPSNSRTFYICNTMEGFGLIFSVTYAIVVYS